MVVVADEEGQESEKKILVWNSTIANLTLMALGSSAPEILLAVIETISSLGSCPGELGASTIVGSAAFNLLIISAVSIYAVSPETDKEEKDEERDQEVEPGIKRIYDLGVFGVTATASVLAYVWMWYCLMDQTV
jgi:solute carrier family 8 (sodium/calcium exchanger)